LGDRAARRDVWFAVVVKSLVHPAIAALTGLAFGLDRAGLLIVTAMAALPTAQNVLVYALRYGRGQSLARDVGLWSTLLLVPVILVISAVLA
ncbi:MAG: AEC family transporter, partial [Actinomycetota bacterium]|nr:AEC family transporter [Actinomycetota bacterium]